MTEHKRITKFRGKRTDNGEWVYGSYHFCVGPGTMTEIKYEEGYRKRLPKAVAYNRHWILVHHTPGDVGWDIEDTYISCDVLPETVGQFTGLPDKKGKEIYEGDIIEFDIEITPDRQDSYQHQGKGIVHWLDAGFCLKINEYRRHERMIVDTQHWTVRKWEVIDNIYEHPELIVNEDQL